MGNTANDTVILKKNILDPRPGTFGAILDDPYPQDTTLGGNPAITFVITFNYHHDHASTGVDFIRLNCDCREQLGNDYGWVPMPCGENYPFHFGDTGNLIVNGTSYGDGDWSDALYYADENQVNNGTFPVVWTWHANGTTTGIQYEMAAYQGRLRMRVTGTIDDLNQVMS